MAAGKSLPALPWARWNAGTRWALALVAGGLLIYGRFSHDDVGGNAAFVLSLFFFCILLPVAYHLTRLIAPRAVAIWVGAIVFVLYAFPFHVLGLDRLRYIDDQHYLGPEQIGPRHTVWFPQALLTFGFQRDFAVVALGFALVCGVAYLLVRYRRLTWSAARVPLIALALICLQTSMHTGMRSPNTYEAHYEPGHATEYWYELFLLPSTGQGAVNRDFSHFNLMNNLFKGAPFQYPTTIFMRPFEHFLAVPLTYFVDAFDAFLILNPLIWLVAVLCTYDLLRRVLGSPEIARYTAALVACANGFVYYVAQPMSYLAYYTGIVLVPWLFERIVVEAADPRERPLRTLLFGAALGLLTLTYDFLGVYPLVVLYAVFRRVPVRFALQGCALGLVIYAAYEMIYLKLGLPNVTATADIMRNSLLSIVALFTRQGVGAWLLQTAGALANYVSTLVLGFMVFALALAAFGFAHADRRTKTLVAVLLVPSLVVSAYLYLGGVHSLPDVLLGSMPRFSYIAFLGVYTAAGAGLAYLRQRYANRTYGPLLPWAIVAFIAIWQNADAFGFPGLTYHFMYPDVSPADAAIPPP